MMRVYRDPESIRGRTVGAAVTVGSFDGVHAGHRALLEALRATARGSDAQSVVVTFDPHPRQVLGSGVELLDTLDEKLLLLESLGVDAVLVVPFTPEFSRLAPDEFARIYLREAVGATHVVTGYNHHFGAGRTGDGAGLASSFEVIPVAARQVNEHKVSSTVIRELVRAGELAEANRCLVDPYFLLVEGGRYDHRGKLLPPDGLWPVTVQAGGGELFETTLPIASGRPILTDIPSNGRSIVRFLPNP